MNINFLIYWIPFSTFFANLLILFCNQVITLLMSSLQIQLQTKQKNRKKLIQQNLRLHAQLQKLQKEIEALDEHFNKKNAQQPHLNELRSQIQAQERQIKQIKELVEAGRQSNLKENIYYIKKEEDQLLWMKQELQNLLKQKDMVYQGHQDKLRKLAANQPLQKHKEQMQKSWADTKKQNRQISVKIVQMQREVRKLHNLKQRGKDKNAESSNQEVELATLQTQIARMSSQIKMKELKWKPNGEVLDNQFFTSRNNLHNLQKRLQQLQRQEGVWRVRSAALRDHSEIMTDRQRLSKIVTMPKPEPIIKAPTPKQTTRQVARQPLFEAGFHKQVRDKIKNDKFVDLVRVSSTPAAMSNLKKQSLPAPIQTELLRKSSLNNHKISKQKSKKQNEKILQMQPNPSKSKNNEASSFKRQKSQKQKKQKQILQQQITDEQLEINKNRSNWLGRRDKIKFKQSNNAGLAQIIRQKAEQVKKMNKKMEEYEQRERSVSSPKKMRSKNEMNRIQTQSQQDKEKHVKLKDKIDLSGQLSKKDKAQKISQKPVIRQNNSVKKSVSINQQSQVSNKKVLKNSRNLRKIRQENLVQKLDMNSKINKFSVEKQSKVKIKNKTPIQTPKKAESPKTIKQKQIKGQINPQKQEQYPKNIQKKPVFQIMITDNPKQNQMHRLETNNLPIVHPDDDTDGIPKIIIRKKANINQVTTGTST